jgi:hypothetical protein
MTVIFGMSLSSVSAGALQASCTKDAHDRRMPTGRGKFSGTQLANGIKSLRIRFRILFYTIEL